MAGEWFHDAMTIENHIAIPCDISVRKRNLEMFQKPAWNTHAYGVKKGRKGPRMFIASIPHHAFDIIRKSLPFLNIIFFKRLNNAAWCSTRWPFDSEKLLDIVASHAAGLKPYSGMACGLEEPSQGVKTVTGKFPEVLFVYEGGTNMVRYPDPVDVFWCICIISTPEQFGEH